MNLLKNPKVKYYFMSISFDVEIHLVFLPEWRYLDRSDWPRSLLKYVLPKQSYEMHPAKAKGLKIHHRGWIWTTMAIHPYLMRDQLGPPGFWLFSILFSASFCYQSREIEDSFIFFTFNYHFPPHFLTRVEIFRQEWLTKITFKVCAPQTVLWNASCQG